MYSLFSLSEISGSDSDSDSHLFQHYCLHSCFLCWVCACLKVCIEHTKSISTSSVMTFSIPYLLMTVRLFLVFKKFTVYIIFILKHSLKRQIKHEPDYNIAETYSKPCAYKFFHIFLPVPNLSPLRFPTAPGIFTSTPIPT